MFFNCTMFISMYINSKISNCGTRKREHDITEEPEMKRKL